MPSRCRRITSRKAGLGRNITEVIWSDGVPEGIAYMESKDHIARQLGWRITLPSDKILHSFSTFLPDARFTPVACFTDGLPWVIVFLLSETFYKEIEDPFIFGFYIIVIKMEIIPFWIQTSNNWTICERNIVVLDFSSNFSLGEKLLLLSTHCKNIYGHLLTFMAIY